VNRAGPPLKPSAAPSSSQELSGIQAQAVMAEIRLAAKVARVDQWRNVRSDADTVLNLSSREDAAAESMLRAA
jgi:hypothetical protein